MTTTSSRNIAPTPAFEPDAELAPGVPLGRKLRDLGRTALAVTCASLALLAVEATGASANSEFQIGAPITRDLAENAPQPSASAAIIPPTSPPEVGVATGSWDDDGLGYHTLFKDIAAEGMTEVRLNLMSMPEMHSEVVSAANNNVEPVISLPLNTTPQQDAQIATQLPQADRFVVGNEVNSPLFSDLSPQQYVDLLAQVNQAIHAVRPDAEVSGFALASGYQPLKYLTQAIQYADQNYGGLPMDSLDFHLYRTLDTDLSVIADYQQIYSGPMHIGELGWIVNDPDQAGSVSLADQASNETTFYDEITQNPQIRSFDLFKYRANSADPFDTANVAADGSFRPAY